MTWHGMVPTSSHTGVYVAEVQHLNVHMEVMLTIMCVQKKSFGKHHLHFNTDNLYCSELPLDGDISPLKKITHPVPQPGKDSERVTERKCL